jgi:uncharacterized phage-associated protein
MSVLAVANTFLEFAKEEGRVLTHMEIQKHTFFAHVWHLVYMNGPLIDDEIQAWKFGPVIPTMYHAFKGFGNGPIDKYGVEFDRQRLKVIAPRITEENLRSFLRKVWDAYKGFTAAELSALSHEPGGPWDQVYCESDGGVVRNVSIPNMIIESYYRRRAGQPSDA